MDVMGLIASTKMVAEIAKELKNMSEAIQQQEFRAKVLGLMDEALNAKEQALELRLEIQNKDEEIRQLKDQLNQKRSMLFNEGLYWVDGDATPFCPRCYEVDDRLVHMAFMAGYVCKKYLNTPPKEIPDKWSCISCGLLKDV